MSAASPPVVSDPGGIERPAGHSGVGCAAITTKGAGLTIDLALVPGDKPRTRFVDEDDEERTGMPIMTCTRR